MIIQLNVRDESVTPNLQRKIENQKQHGGKLVAYTRCWALIAMVVSQTRIEWVPPGSSRLLAGWKQSLFTVIFGIWSLLSFLTVPMILIQNFRGGVDVTEFFSTTSIDPLRSLRPVSGTALKDEKNNQIAVLILLLLILAGIILYNCFRSES